MKKTQKIKHKKHPNSVHLTKKARLIKRRHQIRRQKQFLCFILFLIIILSLSFLFLRPLRTSRQTHMINSACESYRSDVEQVAAKYDMSAYVDLILALMMQESSGQGTDVMQSSEGAYNTQYPQTPNGITDVDYSIACGIQELKYQAEKPSVPKKILYTTRPVHGTMEISIIRNMYFVTIIPKSLDSYKMFFINFSNFFEKTFDNYNYIWYYMSCR